MSRRDDDTATEEGTRDETTSGPGDKDYGGEAVLGSEGGGGWSGGGEGTAPEHDTSIVEDTPEDVDDGEVDLSS
jgi:hypothetical protein